MPAAFLLAQHIHLRLGPAVGLHGTRRYQHLPPLHLVPVHPPQQNAHRIARFRSPQQLVEHLQPRRHRLADIPGADDLHLLPHIQLPPLHAPGHHRPPPLDAEHILNRHQERLVGHPLRLRNVLVHRPHQLAHAGHILGVPFQRLQPAHPHDRRIVAGKIVSAEQLAHLQLHQLQQLLIVHHIHLVQGDYDGRNLHLAGQQNVLPRLRHRPIGRRNHQHRAVHLGCAGNHILDVVGVTGAVNMGVVPVLGLVFHMGNGDSNATRLLLRRVVNIVHIPETGIPLLRQHPRDGGREGGLAVVNVTNSTHVHVRFRTVEGLLGHSGEFLLAPCRSASLRSPGREPGGTACRHHPAVGPSWSPRAESNRRPRSYQERALPLSYLGAMLRCRSALVRKWNRSHNSGCGGGGRIRTCEALPGARFTVWWL